MKKIYYCLLAVIIFQLAIVGAWAAKSDCGKAPNVPPKPAKKVDKDDPAVQNDYVSVVKETAGAVYLTLLNGSQPKANACGLNPTNPSAEWTGWGGPFDGDNVTIGEGAATRNDIVIGGVLFERGIGTHAAAKYVYPLTGAKYVKFEGYVGMSDEKDPAECGNGGSSAFTFTVDGKQMFKSAVQKGTDGGNNMPPAKVEFAIPAGAKELVINVDDGGDGNSCDHACLGDAKLIPEQLSTTSVSPAGRLSITWGDIKVTY